MIRSAILALTLIGALVSGVGMVSAFEALLVNVEAKVENAVAIDGGGTLLFGTVFPEEFIKKSFLVTFSGSFSQVDQTRVEHLDYEVWVEDKGAPYLCMADFMYIGIENLNFANVPTPPLVFRPVPAGGDLVPVGTCTLPKLVTSGTLHKEDSDGDPNNGVQWVNHDDRIYIYIDVPGYEDFHNPLTDAIGCTDTSGDGVPDNPPDQFAKPSGLCKPTVIIGTGDPRYDPEGLQNPPLVGAEITIQITKIYK